KNLRGTRNSGSRASADGRSAGGLASCRKGTAGSKRHLALKRTPDEFLRSKITKPFRDFADDGAARASELRSMVITLEVNLLSGHVQFQKKRLRAQLRVVFRTFYRPGVAIKVSE